MQFGSGTATIYGTDSVTGDTLVYGYLGTVDFKTAGTIPVLYAEEGTATFDAPTSITTFTMVGGYYPPTLAANQTVTVTGSGTWSGGTVTGTLAVAVGATLTLNTGQVLDGTLTNSGTVSWTDSSTLTATNATINNQAGGLFDIKAAAGITASSTGTTPAIMINNAGILRKEPSGSLSTFTAGGSGGIKGDGASPSPAGDRPGAAGRARTDRR